MGFNLENDMVRSRSKCCIPFFEKLTTSEINVLFIRLPSVLEEIQSLGIKKPVPDTLLMLRRNTKVSGKNRVRVILVIFFLSSSISYFFFLSRKLGL